VRVQKLPGYVKDMLNIEFSLLALEFISRSLRQTHSLRRTVCGVTGLGRGLAVGQRGRGTSRLLILGGLVVSKGLQVLLFDLESFHKRKVLRK
jgi:hypothetical protein